MTIDERIEALAVNHKVLPRQDSKKIHALLRIAERRERG